MSTQVVLGLIEPASGVVDVEEPHPGRRCRSPPEVLHTDELIGIDVGGGEDRGIEREGKAVIAPQQRDALKPTGRHLVLAEIRKGEVGLIQRGHDGRPGEGAGPWPERHVRLHHAWVRGWSWAITTRAGGNSILGESPSSTGVDGRGRGGGAWYHLHLCVNL